MCATSRGRDVEEVEFETITGSISPRNEVEKETFTCSDSQDQTGDNSHCSLVSRDGFNDLLDVKGGSSISTSYSNILRTMSDTDEPFDADLPTTYKVPEDTSTMPGFSKH